MDEGIFFSRDLSWIDFNARVLAEGLKKDLPLLERLRFITIVSSNFDEYFMVRMAALKRAHRHGVGPDPSGLSPKIQLAEASRKVRLIVDTQYQCLRNDIFPGLAQEGVELIRPNSYSEAQRAYLESFFIREIHPILTPLRFAPGEVDRTACQQGLNEYGEDGNLGRLLNNMSLYGAFLLLEESTGQERVAVVQIPPILNHLIWLPRDSAEIGGPTCFALVEDLLLLWGGLLFSGFQVKERMLLRISRDADFSVDERRDEDFLEAMEEVLIQRNSSRVVRMVCSTESPRLQDELASRLSLEAEDIYQIDGPLDLRPLTELLARDDFDRLRLKSAQIGNNPALPEDKSLWDVISHRDVMLHHPYQSFDPVVRFFKEAAVDPQVVAIKTALYRTSGDSPIIQALEDAALNGKHVTAVVELKARFDEERNISWANRLERAGVIVVYGLAQLKIHAKICLVIRREQNGMNRYVHLSTGNYNDKTAKQYEDIGFFTAREDIAYDAGLLFNMLTGYSAINALRLLYLAPINMKDRILELIDREIKQSSPESPGRIIAKMNSLSDPDVIKALYRASQGGVRIQLCVRGICMLVPGVEGMSENIQVVSIIDRFLEHSRVFFFNNAGSQEFYISSADWMPRNLERRVELWIPVLQPDLQEELRLILEAYFKDNTQAWRLSSSGDWVQSRAALEGWDQLEMGMAAPAFRIQEFLLSRALESRKEIPDATRDFIVRRTPAEHTPYMPDQLYIPLQDDSADAPISPPGI